MKYRLDITLFLDDRIEAEKIRDALIVLKRLFRTINKGLDTEEKSFIRLHKCYHDEDPSKPCEDLFYWESD